MEDIFVDNEKERRSNCYNYRRMALQNQLRIIVCHYYLRCSYQLHGSVMATKSFLTCLNLQILRQKIYIAIYTTPCVDMSVSVHHDSSFREETGFFILYANGVKIYEIANVSLE